LVRSTLDASDDRPVSPVPAEAPGQEPAVVVVSDDEQLELF
jgi:hypothetical protein